MANLEVETSMRFWMWYLTMQCGVKMHATAERTRAIDFIITFTEDTFYLKTL